MANEALMIWNRALAVLGAPRIEDAAHTSSQKTLIDDHWVGIRKEFVSLHPWDGCTTVVDLVVATPATKPDRWKKAFTLPTDFIQAWRVNDLPEGQGSQPLWEVLTLQSESPPVKVVLMDRADCKLEYGFDPDSDVKLALLNGTTTTALVHRLALAISRPFGKKDSDLRVIQGEYEEALHHARYAVGRQQKKKADRDRPLVDARFNTGRLWRTGP